MAHDLHLATTDAVRVPLGGRDRIGRLTGPAYARGEGPRRTAVVEEEVQWLGEKALHVVEHFLPLSKSTIGFQGQHANLRCIRP
jgi:hypothetical protein